MVTSFLIERLRGHCLCVLKLRFKTMCHHITKDSCVANIPAVVF